MQPLTWDCGFETRRGHGCRSVVSASLRHVEMPLRHAEHSSKGALPSVCVCVSLSVIR
jgi:hypothetical protein